MFVGRYWLPRQQWLEYDRDGQGGQRRKGKSHGPNGDVVVAQLVTANVIKWERLDPFAFDGHGFPRAGFASYMYSI